MASLIQNSITKFELILVLINFLKNLNYTPLAENAKTIISCTLSNHQHFVRVNASRGRPMDVFRGFGVQRHPSESVPAMIQG